MNKQVNLVPVIVVAVLIVLGLVYFFLVRPGQQEAQIKKEWTSDAAAAARGPGKTHSQEYESKVQELLAKEGKAVPQNVGSRRRDRE